MLGRLIPMTDSFASQYNPEHNQDIIKILCLDNYHMTIAFVLISCDLGSEESIIEQLKSIVNVKEVQGIFGAYDILTKVESSSTYDLKEIVMQKIRKIPDVRSTLTLTCIEGQE